jgi:hypothetical protein
VSALDTQLGFFESPHVLHRYFRLDLFIQAYCAHEMFCPTLHTSVHVNFIEAHKTLTPVFIFFAVPTPLSLSLAAQ